MKRWKRIAASLLALSLCMAGPAAGVRAEEGGAVTGTYQFTSCKDDNRQMTDEFTWRDDCFARSSYLGCTHLALLSAQAAQASASYYGPEEDHFEVDFSDASHNIRLMLEDMGFTGCEVNEWYDREKNENTMGVAVGMKKLETQEGEYTLLAIIPRSAGYKREWAGDFTVGGGSIHEGFKQARDEVLRFTKKYIEENNVQGPLKVWTAGHSRGSAVAGMTAAFFAGGGIDYFGDSVSITPEDVYCCGFATPLMIKPGTEKAEELSVSAARGGEYAYDTPGDEWVSDAEGELDPQAEVYGGIRNYLLRYDMISLLPPGQWDFTCYGSTVYLDDEAAVSVDEMLEELKVLSPAKYEAAQETGDPRAFAWKTYDLVNLEAVDSDTVPAEGTEGFLKGRVEGLVYHVPTNEIYADGTWQEALTALASVYGMLMNNFGNIKDDYLPRLAEPIGYMYFAYAAERLIEEGRAADEAEAAAIAAEDLIETLTGTRPDGAITVDDFFGIIARFIADNEDSPLAEKLYSNVDGLVSSAAGMVLRMGIAPYTKSEEAKDASMGDLVKNFVRACAYGPDPESPAAKTFTDAQSVRKIFYGLSSFIFSSFAPGVSEAFGRNEANVTDGSGSFGGLVQALYENFRVAERKNGEIVRTYESFAEAADETLAEIFTDILADPLAQAEELYGQEYRAAAEASVDTMAKDIDDVREILSYVLFYVEGEEFSADAALRNVYTYVENVNIVMQAHNYEIYTSWAKAADRKFGEEH